MGLSESKNKSHDDFRTEGHMIIIKIFAELSTDQTLTESALIKLFPNRTLFTKVFFQWMESLSYKNSANRESFVFACEILSLDSEQVLKEQYKNHTFGHLEIFLHMILQTMPNKIEQATSENVESYIDLILNFFLGDSIDPAEGKEAVMGMIAKRTEIANGPISHHILLKSPK